jgi:hypothetical protein
VTPRAELRRTLTVLTRPRGATMGWFLWGVVLPVLLVVAGVMTIRRRRR